MSSLLLLISAALLLAMPLIQFLFLRRKKLNLPIIGGEHCENKSHRAALIEGTQKYPNTPYLINTDHPLVILPASVINEIRNLPEEKASFLADLRERFASNKQISEPKEQKYSK